MKANVENFKKAMQLCAEAHKVEFCDWYDEDGQVALKSEAVPVVNDVMTIVEAFSGPYCEIEVDWGYTNVYISDAEFKDEVDEATLAMALPYGWMERMVA